MTLTAAEKNAHYGFLNARFDDRAAELFKLGFKYEGNEDIGIAYFIRGNVGFKPTTIPAATLLFADDIVWGDKLEAAARGR